ncbi:MAG: cyanophycin synthetase [Candidatus Sumerlaeia bacterium]
MKNGVRPILGQILQKIAPTIGATINIEPKWGIVGQIVFKNGRKRYFRYSTMDLNPVGASDIAKDKDYANFFMKKMGYPTIPGQAFFSDHWAHAIGSKRNIDAAYRFALKLGFPVFVKPNSGSQGVGAMVVHNKRELFKALHYIFMHDKVALVQKTMVGKDYRVVVLNNQIISAYQRIPLSIVGDGKSSILRLLRDKQIQFVKSGRDTKIKLDDFRIAHNLKRQGLSFHSVLPKQQRIYLLKNANLSTGGDSLDVTNIIHPGYKKIAIQVTKDMGLRLCGVDLMVENDISKEPDVYWIIEINAAPGLDHYIKTGKEQEKIVEDMYLAILKALQ